MQSVNPASEQVVREFSVHTEDDVDRLLRAAQSAFETWRGQSIKERSRRFSRLAAILRERRADYAALMVEEMGKPIEEAEAEVEKCAWVCDFYVEHAKEFLQEQTVDTEAAQSVVRFEPMGPILAVMPWNFPFWQVFRCAVPAVMAGNVMLLKHASNVCGCGVVIEDAFRESGFPQGVFTTLLIGSDKIANLIGRPEICGVSLTGSERAGMSVGEAAGKNLKKSVLELGGSDPFLVLSDVDIESVAGQAAKARTINNGQSCIAAKRFIVDEGIADQFEQALVLAMTRFKMGDPLDRTTNIGPLARGDLRETLHKQVTGSIDAGARLLSGGRIPRQTGYFYPPTVVTNVQPGMPLFDEESFGPAAAVIRARDPEHMIELANQGPYGLGASVWTKDPGRAENLTHAIRAGLVFVNKIVQSDPRLPFGGIKRSGLGRELGEFGIREFVNIKTVWIETA